MMTFRNILIVRTDRIGDVVLTTPAMHALRQAFPGARITLWVAPATRDLVKGLSWVDEVVSYERKGGLIAFGRFLSSLRRRKFDLAVIYHTKRNTNLTCFLAGIPVRLGYRNNKFGSLLTHPVKDVRHQGEKHEAAYCLDLLEAIGVRSHNLRPKIAFQSVAEEWARGFVAANLKPGERLVAIHPDASCPTKLWPAAHFSALMGRLSMELGVRVVLVGASPHKPLFQEIRRSLKNDILDLTGKTSVAEMASLFKRCALVVSNDSGPVHVADAAGAPVISLFLRQQPGLNQTRWRPLGSRSRVLVNKPHEAITVDRENRIVSGRFDSITVDDVFRACQEVLSSSPTKA